MKLILKQEVAGLGGPGDVVEVADGYGRNYLVPQRLAIPATRGAEKQIATIRRAREVREVRDLGQARELAATLQAMTVKVPSRAGEGGRLFGSVTAADVAEAVVRGGGPKLDKRRISLAAAVKTVGTHTARVRVHSELDATLTFEVVPLA